MIGISLISLLSVGMYRFIVNHDWSEWFFIWIICKYGDMFAEVGILVIIFGKAYLLLISINSPLLAGVYGILCCIHLVRACVLLNIKLYCRNRF